MAVDHSLPSQKESDAGLCTHAPRLHHPARTPVSWFIRSVCAVCGRCILTATLLAATACASTHAVPGVASLRAAAPVIEVTNDRLDYVVVYVIHSGVRFKLGVVPAMGRRTFTPTRSQLGTGALVTLGAGRRDGVVDQVTLPLTLLPGSDASWIVRERWIEQPVVR